MKILYDHQIFQIQKFGGISRGLAEIVTHFPKAVDYEIALKESNNIYLKSYSLNSDAREVSHNSRDNFLPNLKFRGKNRIYDFLCQRNLINTAESINIKYSKKLLAEGKYDVFHPSYFDDYFLDYLNGKPFVLTVHDLTTEKYPQFFSSNDFQTRMRKVLVPKAAHIIAVSESTKRDVMNRWNIPSDKITVVYRGANSMEICKEKPVSLYSFPYILFVGLRDGYKNFNFFIKQTAPFLHVHKDIKIICTGRNLNEAEQILIKELGLTNRVETIFATDAEMKSLYGNAICFVFPSLSEGFGLPTLEAFQNGCPVLLFNGTCHPEVGGDAAFYYDSDGKDSDIQEKLELIFNLSAAERQQVIDNGYRRLQDFSWEKASQQYVEVYKSLL